MADNVTIPATTAYSFAADDVAGVMMYVVKLNHGADGASDPTSNANPFPVKAQAYTSGGATPYRHTATGTGDEDANVIKGSAGQLYHLFLTNVAGTTKFFKLYNVASAPTEANTPVHVIAIPTLQTVFLEFPAGLAFSTGISFRITGAVGDGDTTALTANDVTVNAGYK